LPKPETALATNSPISPITWGQDQLELVDQRFLPSRHDSFVCRTLEDAATAIRELVVRGAPAIGITAAYGVYLGYLQSIKDDSYDLSAALDHLAGARPTAVNLAWAVDIQRAILGQSGTGVGARLLERAREIHRLDIDDNRRMGDLGANLIGPGSRVMTHCNAGALATGGYGTALGVIRSAWRDGKLDAVYASETRPWQQGLRLTAWELAEDGIPVTVIVEGAVSSLMSRRGIDWVIVGSDRICANGDVVNKVGTCNAAILARHFGARVMVAAPLSTVDMQTPSGDKVEIETRAEREVLGDHYASSERVCAWNPVFDVTPAALVDAIVTEKGVVLQPDEEKMWALVEG
jgi:methylthioribose-1-phosphate isomerase